MTPDAKNQEIGETVARMLPDGAAFIVIYHDADRRKIRTVSNLEPDALLIFLEDQVEILRAGRISALTVHEHSDPS